MANVMYVSDEQITKICQNRQQPLKHIRIHVYCVYVCLLQATIYGTCFKRIVSTYYFLCLLPKQVVTLIRVFRL